MKDVDLEKFVLVVRLRTGSDLKFKIQIKSLKLKYNKMHMKIFSSHCGLNLTALNNDCCLIYFLDNCLNVYL